MLKQVEVMTLNELKTQIDQLKREKIEKGHEWVGTIVQDGGITAVTLKQDLDRTELNLVNRSNSYTAETVTFPYFFTPSLSQNSIIYLERDKLFGIISPAQ